MSLCFRPSSCVEVRFAVQCRAWAVHSMGEPVHAQRRCRLLIAAGWWDLQCSMCRPVCVGQPVLLCKIIGCLPDAEPQEQTHMHAQCGQLGSSDPSQQSMLCPTEAVLCRREAGRRHHGGPAAGDAAARPVLRAAHPESHGQASSTMIFPSKFVRFYHFLPTPKTCFGQ